LRFSFFLHRNAEYLSDFFIEKTNLEGAYVMTFFFQWNISEERANMSAVDQSEIILVKHRKNSKQPNATCRYLSLILCSIFCTTLLGALIIPTIFTYKLATRMSRFTSTNQSELSESVTYRAHCRGVSSYSQWTVNTTYVMTMIVNTTQCNFNNTPLYFAAVTSSAISGHWCLIGHNAIYYATNESFQVYAKSTCVLELATTLISSATGGQWNLAWIGFYR